ncbi:MAG: hypothetical protein IT247_07490 [Bacteroidia bacterium]|nr:hypothetical protein [Bacteroidia bacterium]
MGSRALLLVFFLATQQVLAQGTGGGGDPDVPIDGGLGILLAAGITYGVKRVMKTQNETSSGEKE